MPTYSRLRTAPTLDPKYCFVATTRRRGRLQLATGKSTAAQYPDDPLTFRLLRDPDFGEVLPDLLGNTQGFLLLSSRAREALEAADLRFAPCEVHPFTLADADDTPLTTDYAFVNPLGTHDIAHPKSDLLRYANSRKIYGCTRWVLDANKLHGLADLVRAREVPKHYFVSERFVEVVRERRLTNFDVVDLEHV